MGGSYLKLEQQQKRTFVLREGGGLSMKKAQTIDLFINRFKEKERVGVRQGSPQRELN